MMSGNHLNQEMIGRMLDNELTDEERSTLISHLDSGCRECESFLAELTGEHEEELICSYICRPTEGDTNTSLSDEEMRGIFTSVRSELSSRSLPKARVGAGPLGGRMPWKSLALAAGVILALGLTIFYHRHLVSPPGPNIKGDEPITERNIFLQFSVLQNSTQPGAEPEIILGVNRAVYPSDGHLIFRYELELDSRVYIVRVGPDGVMELLYPAPGDRDQVRRAGVYDVNQADKFLVYPLEDLSGLQTFCAVALSPDGATRKKAAGMAQSLAGQNGKQPISGRLRKEGIDCFQVTVD